MVCCGQNGIAPLGQNGIMMSHCIGLKNIKMQFVLSSHAYNISLTLFSRCTSLIVIIEKYCITLYFHGRKISRKVNLKYFREKIFSRIYCSRENIFPRKYLPAKISTCENIIFPRFFSVPQICRLVGVGYAVYRLFRKLFVQQQYCFVLINVICLTRSRYDTFLSSKTINCNT